MSPRVYVPRTDAVGRREWRESPWTPDEYAYLGRLLRAGCPFEQAAFMLGRTVSTVDRRSRMVGERQRDEPVPEPPRYCTGCGKPLSLYNPRPVCYPCQARQADRLEAA